jgi:hypothetical protein
MRLMIEDARYEAYRVDLEAKRALYMKALLRPNLDHVRMSRLAGQISALDYALGLPAQLLDSDPSSRNPETP